MHSKVSFRTRQHLHLAQMLDRHDHATFNDVVMSICQTRASQIQVVSLGLFLVAVSAASALELHVATNGNDAWTGKLTRPNSARDDGPLATLTGARNAIR